MNYAMIQNRSDKFDFKLEPAVPIYKQIAAHFESRICRGVLRPGEPLPSCRELARIWKVNFQTARKAMHRLKAVGLVSGEPRGLSLVGSANTAAMVGIMIGTAMADEPEHFNRAIVKHLETELMRRQGRRWSCRVYDGWYGGQHKVNRHNFWVGRQLADDLQRYAFKAVVEIGMVEIKGCVGILKMLPDMNESLRQFIRALPTVRLNFCFDRRQTDVLFDYRRFGRDVADYVARQGLKRIVYLRTLNCPPGYTPDLDGLEERTTATGLPRAEVHQLATAWRPGVLLEQCAYERTLELMKRWHSGAGKNGRPDALLVSDDITARGVAMALATQRAETLKILLIIMTNEGITHHYGRPVIRYEYSPKAVARSLVEILQQRVLGEATATLPVLIQGHLIDFNREAFSLKSQNVILDKSVLV